MTACGSLVDFYQCAERTAYLPTMLAMALFLVMRFLKGLSQNSKFNTSSVIIIFLVWELRYCFVGFSVSSGSIATNTNADEML
jgi:hypothetical protein